MYKESKLIYKNELLHNILFKTHKFKNFSTKFFFPFSHQKTV